MEKATYWKLKAIELEGQVLEQRVQASVAAWRAKRALVYAEAGLAPEGTYTLDDATEQAVPMSDTPTGAA